MTIEALRKSIPSTKGVAYFNTGWSGPSPEPVINRIHEVFEAQAAAGPARRNCHPALSPGQGAPTERPSADPAKLRPIRR